MLPLERAIARRPSYRDEAPRVMPFSPTRRPTSGAVRTTGAARWSAELPVKMLPLGEKLIARRPSYLDEAPRVVPFSPDPSADQRSCADD